MAEIKQQPNLDWFATLPKMQQEFLHESYPTDELKQGWFDLGKPYVYEGPYNYPMEVDPMTGIGPGNIRKMVNFEINPKFGVLGEFRMERNRPLKEFKEDPNPASYTALAEFPYYMKTLPLYFNPATAPFAAGFDVFEGIYDRNPLQVGLSSLGVGGISKMVQAALAGGALYMPKDADATIISKALGYIKGIATKAKGQPITSTANALLKNLEETIGTSGKVKGVEFKAIREHLQELKYASDEVQPLTKIVDDINSFNYFDDIVTDSVDTQWGKAFVTRLKPETHVVDGKNAQNAKNLQISKNVNRDAEIHFPISKQPGVLSHQLYKVDGDVLKISEYQSDMSSHAFYTGFKGTSKNKEFIDQTMDIYKAMEPMPSGGIDPATGMGVSSEGRALVFPETANFVAAKAFVPSLMSSVMPVAQFKAIIKHNLFPKKVFEEWKQSYPGAWKQMQKEMDMDKTVNLQNFFKGDGSPADINPLEIFHDKMKMLDPIQHNAGTGIFVREAPNSHPLLLNDNWLHYEIANTLEQATLNPNIKRIEFPTAEEVINRYLSVMTPGLETYLTNIYVKELPRILKNMGGNVTKAGDIIENSWHATNGSMDMINMFRFMSDPTQPQFHKIVDEIIDNNIEIQGGAVKWVQKNILGDAQITISSSKNHSAKTIIEGIDKGSMAKGYLDKLELVAQEIIRNNPKSEKAINKYLEMIYAADGEATAATKFANKYLVDDWRRMVQNEVPENPGGSVRGIHEFMANYSDNYAFKFEEILNNLPKNQKKILEESGLIAQNKVLRSHIEVTPELIDKVQNVGVTGI